MSHGYSYYVRQAPLHIALKYCICSFIVSRGWGHVSVKQQPLMDTSSSPETTRSSGWMIMTKENRMDTGEDSPSATLFTTDITLTILAKKPGLCGDKPRTNRLNSRPRLTCGYRACHWTQGSRVQTRPRTMFLFKAIQIRSTTSFGRDVKRSKAVGSMK
jgi:hypothetical protein